MTDPLAPTTVADPASRAFIGIAEPAFALAALPTVMIAARSPTRTSSRFIAVPPWEVIEPGAHRSHAMRAFLAIQRDWLVTEQLPAYALELNPVEGLCSNLKGQELANLACETPGEATSAAWHGIERVRQAWWLPYSFLRRADLGDMTRPHRDPNPTRGEQGRSRPAKQAVTHWQSAGCVGAGDERYSVPGGPRSARSRCS